MPINLKEFIINSLDLLHANDFELASSAANTPVGSVREAPVIVAFTKRWFSCCSSQSHADCDPFMKLLQRRHVQVSVDAVQMAHGRLQIVFLQLLHTMLLYDKIKGMVNYLEAI